MGYDRARVPAVWSRWCGLVLLLVISTACVYFNTFYNAQKYFDQAEKARRKDIQEASRREAEGRIQLDPKTKQLYEKAAKKASRVLEKYPHSDRIDDALFMLGKAFYWQDDYQSAARSFADLQRNFPHSRFFARSRYWQARCLEQEGSTAQARSMYQELVSGTDPQVAAEAGLRLGELDYDQGDYVAAVDEFRSTLKAWPRSPAAPRLWFHLGQSLFALDDSTRYDEAIRAFQRVRQGHPSTETEYRARLALGRVLQAQGKDVQALEEYQSLLKDGRFRAFEGQTRILIGRYYQERGDFQAALDQYEQVRDDFPQTSSSAMALYQTALLYLREYGDEDRARDYLDEVGREQGRSEAAQLAREMLGYLQELARLRADIQRADSLAAVRAARDSTAVHASRGDSLGSTGGGRSASGDSAAVAEPDTALHSGSAAGARSDSAGSAPVGTIRGQIEGRGADGGDDVLESLLAAAELYRDPARIAVPDSAIHYLKEVLQRAPHCVQRPRVLYSLAWIHLESKHDPAGARPFLEELIRDYPHSEYANAARERLGLPKVPTDAEAAEAEFRRIEDIRLQDIQAVSEYVPMLDSLADRYPGTEAAARAAFVAAFTVENVAGDSLEAARRYAALRARFPHTEYARLVAARDSVIQHGLITKLERGIKSVGGSSLPGERITVLAAAPDTVDSLASARRFHALALRAQRRGDLERARENFELSLQERQRQPDVHYQLGNVLFQQGYVPDAMEQWREALAERPNMLGPMYRLCAAFTEEGRADSASHYLRAIMQRDPRNPQVKLLREEHPELSHGGEPEDLDLGELQKMNLVPPPEDLELQPDPTLKELPVVRHPVLPEAPAGLRDTVTVILDVLVDKDGCVDQVEVFDGPDSLREAAVSAARRYTFFPGLDRRERLTPVWVELEIPFLPGRRGAEESHGAPVDSLSGG